MADTVKSSITYYSGNQPKNFVHQTGGNIFSSIGAKIMKKLAPHLAESAIKTATNMIKTGGKKALKEGFATVQKNVMDQLCADYDKKQSGGSGIQTGGGRKRKGRSSSSGPRPKKSKGKVTKRKVTKRKITQKRKKTGKKPKRTIAKRKKSKGKAKRTPIGRMDKK